ncbi:MAG: MFS transporter [Clostridia bacterium]|nr:MFS transporter [Clostridia bacterium]
MSILLLIVIFMAFIALGIPDSLIGAAWPAIYADYSIPETYISFVTMTIYGCVVISSILSTKVLQKIGTAKTTALSTALIAAGILGFSFSPNLICMCLFAILIGFGGGAINTGLNNYVELHYQARHMNYLHCFYGVGTICSTSLLTATLEKSGWRTGYRYIFIVQIVIALLIFISIPIWKKEDTVTEENSQVTQKKLSIIKMLGMPAVRTLWYAIFTTNAIEFAVGYWLSTYLVNAKDISLEQGAFAATLYYAGMAFGRFLSGLISEKIKTWNRIGVGLAIVSASVIILVAPLPGVLTISGMFLIGFGNGSIYPNLIHLTPHNFGEEFSQSITASEIAVAYLGVMVTLPVSSLVIGLLGINIFPIFLAVIAAVMFWSLWRLTRLLKKQDKYNKEV